MISRLRPNANDGTTGRAASPLLRLLCLLLSAAMPAAFGAVTFDGVVSPLTVGTSLDLPAGLAFDLQGNVYIADANNNRIVKVASNGAVAPVAGVSLSNPRDVSVDSDGVIYIADTGNSRIMKVDALGISSSLSTPSITLNAPQSVAVNVSGDIFIADTGNSRIVKVTSDGTASLFTLSGLGTPLASPRGVAVDANGNLYIADYGNSRVVRATSAGAASEVAVALGQPLDGPSDVAVTLDGSLYIADTNTVPTTTPGRIVEIDAQGNASVVLAGTPSFQSPTGVAVNAHGAIYVGDTGNDSIMVLQVGPVDAGHARPDISNTTVTLPFTVSAASTLTSVKAFTEGNENVDLTIDGSSTCAAAVTNASCAVVVTFAPADPGSRRGSIVLSFDTSGTPQTLVVPVFGHGDAPIAVVSPGIASVFPTGPAPLPNPYQTAVDAAGNVYVATYTGKKVYRVPAGGGTAVEVPIAGFTTQNLTGVAIDPAGNLFVGDHQNSRILKIDTAGNASLFSLTGLSPVLGFPTALAFDPSGNLYIADFTNGRIVKANPAGKAMVLATAGLTFTGSTVTGVAADASGTVYIADRSRIVRVDAFGKASLLPITSAGPLTSPQGVAADPAGNVYAIDTGHNRIIRYTTSGVTSVMQFSGSQFGPTTFGITADSHGRLLLADWTNNRLLSIDSSRSTFAFGVVAGGSTSAPQTLTVANLGNLDLQFPVPGSGSNPAVTPGFLIRNTSTCPLTSAAASSPGTLAAGANCVLNAAFSPVAAGATTGSLVLTDSAPGALPANYQTQTMTLSGTATQATPALTWQAPASIPYGTVLGAAQLNANSSVAGSFVYTPATGSLLAVGTNTLSAAFTPTDTVGYVSGNVSTTIAIGKAATSLAVTSSTANAGQGRSVTFTASVAAGYGTPSGAVELFNGSTSLGSGSLDANGEATIVVSVLPVGSTTLSAEYSGDASYLASMSSVDQSVSAASFGISASPPTLVLRSTESGQVTVTLTPTSGFTGTVTLGCTGLPEWEDCRFSNTTFMADGSDTPQTSVITIAPRQQVAALGMHAGSNTSAGLAALLLLPGFALGGTAFRSRRGRGKVRTLLALIGILLGFAVLGGCGDSYHGTSQDNGQPVNTGTYTVAVTATATQTLTGYEGPMSQMLNLSISVVP